ncbi:MULTISPECIES: hypothetical protein [Rhodopseudomonas]|nr:MULTISPECIES: hypothetical protein [Rhodopseudomonas]MDF3810653.1 hypothetical protein [Rhodopseudomonas sp. BAL398]WOK18446.1 hypothetical protein RBJ75_02635 [Rhodopseudomonas sp. BAL398]
MSMKRVAQALMLLTVTAVPAWADSGGIVMVRPGRPGVPIIINGVDASYRVVEGDWGLLRGTHVQPTVYGGRYIDPVPRVGHYFPRSTSLPGYGRLEIEPPANRKLPQPAESYHESWSAQSAPPTAQPMVPFDPPNVIVAPPERGMYAPERRPDYSRPRN